MRLKHLFIQECYSMKLPFSITRLFPWLFSPPGNCFQKSPFHLANFHSSFMTHLHCSSSRKPSLTPQKESLPNLGQVQKPLPTVMIYSITC